MRDRKSPPDGKIGIPAGRILFDADNDFRLCSAALYGRKSWAYTFSVIHPPGNIKPFFVFMTLQFPGAYTKGDNTHAGPFVSLAFSVFTNPPPDTVFASLYVYVNFVSKLHIFTHLIQILAS